MIKHGIEESDAVTAVSNNLVELTKNTLEVKKELHVIYNFVNEKKYFRKDMPSFKTQYGITESEKVIVHISNFRKVKRIEDVVHTFYHIQKEIDAKLVLIGDGPECAVISELVDTLELTDKVLFLGKQKRVEDILSIADIKLLMSQKESFGLVLLEAMACGVPCIGTNVGGIPEVIDHGKTGYLVELGDSMQAAKYALQLLTDTETYEQFVHNAQEVVDHRFHSSKIVEQYIDLYNSVYQRKSDTYEKIR